MAHKVTVLPSNSEIPETSQLSKGATLRLVRRGLMDWKVFGKVARRRKIRDFSRAAKLPICCRHFIPTKLPPAEVPNTKFDFKRTEEQKRSGLVCLMIARRLCESQSR